MAKDLIGGIMTITTERTAISSNDTLVKSIRLQSAPTNHHLIHVHNSADSEIVYILSAGKEIVFEVDKASKIFLSGPEGGVIYWTGITQ